MKFSSGAGYLKPLVGSTTSVESAGLRVILAKAPTATLLAVSVILGRMSIQLRRSNLSPVVLDS
mgnify:CR=1 FL=1